MHTLKTVDQVLTDFRTSKDGLSMPKVHAQRQYYGYNELPEHTQSAWWLLVQQCNSILVLILFFALLLSIVLPFYENGGVPHVQDFLDAAAIAVILVLNAVLGFLQERKAENAIASLRQLSDPTVRVMREGMVMTIASRELVPGDILLLEEGDRVSADGRVIEEHRSAVDEAALTGESKPVHKCAEVLSGSLGIADQLNMVFKGTIVTEGRLTVCVTAIGEQTELGKVAELVGDIEHPETPLERSMGVLGRWLGSTVLVFCAIIFLAGILQDLPFTEIMLAAASLAVSAVPEGLPAIVTVCLAIGVQRMVKRNVLTRKLQAIETLGSVTVICTDKTGTITENEMEVQEVWGEERLALQIGASCNNAHSIEVGDPTEIGLLKAAQEAGVSRYSIIEEVVPFSSVNKYMTTAHTVDDRSVQYTKGAPEIVLELCDLTPERTSQVLRKNEEMASRALRVLAMVRDREFVGLVGMMDPPRGGVKEAVALAAQAGVRTIIITGDHALTAKAIAGHIGVHGEVIEGKQLEHMSAEELEVCIERTVIYARVTPSQKVKILELLQARGEIVAMGGDGVNDAPALKKAHVGFAMGKIGTDVARETAEMVLTDDHYASVVAAIEEGRTIYANIRKFIVFLLRANFDELLVVLGAIVIGMPLPYLPIHILLINLMTDSLPAMALAMEKPEPGIMQRPPRNPKEHILHGETVFIVLAAIVATAAAFHVFFVGMREGGVALGRTMVVATSILFELTLVFTCRSRRSLFEIGVLSNRYLLVAVGIAFGLFLTLLYTPLASFVRLVPLAPAEWVLPLIWSVGALLFFEMLKMVRRDRG